MRVLQIVKGLDIGGHNGGSEKFGAELAAALVPLVEEVSLCAFYQHRTAIEQANLERLEQTGVRVFFALERSGGNPWPGFTRLAEFCGARGVQVAHSHFQVGSLGAVLTRLRGKSARIVRTAHITKEWGDGWLAWLSRQAFTGVVFPAAFDAEVGVSQAIASQLNRRITARIGRRRARCIYNALPVELIEGLQVRVEARWQKTESAPAVTIGSVGRLTARKGYAYLLQALALLAEDLPTVRLALVGGGEERPALEDLARRLGLAERVEFAGQQSSVAEWLRRMDLFVLPSLQEGLPTVVLESMACGTPVIATEIPGTRELVQNGENGWLVPPSDAPALAGAIRRAVGDYTARRRCALAGMKTAQGYAISASAAQYVELYRELVG